MSFCNIEDAFDNPLQKQIQEMQNMKAQTQKNIIDVNNAHHKFDLAPPYQDLNQSDDYSNLLDPQYATKMPSETTIDELKNGMYSESQSYFSQDPSLDMNSDFSIPSKYSVPSELDKKSYDINSNDTTSINSHGAVVNKFINELSINKSSKLSTTESNKIFNHLHNCKKCKKDIHNKLSGKKNIKATDLYSNYKSIILNIILGIIALYVLDSCVKLGKFI